MFDPSVGRFLEADPSWPATGEANPFLYAANGPTNATDPSGQWIVARNQDDAGKIKALLENAVPGLRLKEPREGTEGGKYLPFIIDEVDDPDGLTRIEAAIQQNSRGGTPHLDRLLNAIRNKGEPHVDVAVLGAGNGVNPGRVELV